MFFHSDNQVSANLLPAIYALALCVVVWVICKWVGRWLNRDLFHRSLRTYVEPSDTSKAIFLARAMSGSFRFRLALVSRIYGRRYGGDHLVFVRAISQAFMDGVLRCLVNSSSPLTALAWREDCVDLLNEEFPDANLNLRILSFLFGGLRCWDAELLFWVHHRQIETCSFES